MIERNLFQFLKDDAGVGAQVADRIYYLHFPPSATKPALVFFRVSSAPTYDMGGAAMQQARIQMDAWGETAEAANDAGQAVRDALDHFDGTMGTNAVALIEIADERHDYDEEARLFRDSTDYMIWYS